jgi:HNH endonuclease
VLVAAGGEAALGLIPGLKAGNKARKALDKAEDVADAAGDVGRAAGQFPKPKVGSADPLGAGRPFSQTIKDQARAESGNTCVFCRTATTNHPGPTRSEIDHAIPKSRGGDNSVGNAQNTCRTCNRRKSAKTTEEFIE